MRCLKRKRIGLRTRGRRPTKHTIFGTQNHDGAGESTQYRPEDRPNFFIKAGSAIRKAAASSGTRMNIVAGKSCAHNVFTAQTSRARTTAFMALKCTPITQPDSIVENRRVC